jgi:hypothetical protein
MHCANQKVTLGLARSESFDQVIGIELYANGVVRKSRSHHKSVGFFVGFVNIDLELHSVAVRVPIIQRDGDAMV